MSKHKGWNIIIKSQQFYLHTVTLAVWCPQSFHYLNPFQPSLTVTLTIRELQMAVADRQTMVVIIMEWAMLSHKCV